MKRGSPDGDIAHAEIARTAALHIHTKFGVQIQKDYMNKFFFNVLCGLTALVPTTAMAGLINGSQLNIAGTATVGAASITWLCNQPGDPVCVSPPAGKGDFAVSSSTGSFVQYNGTFGLIANINSFSQPLNMVFSLNNFLTFNLNNDITVELTFIPLGTNTPSSNCAGLTHCTPQNNGLITAANPLGLSAFNLDQQGTNTAAAFGVVGTVHQLGGATANLNGIFTAQFANSTPQSVLANLGGPNSTYSSNLSLVLTAATPEPGTWILAGTALIGIGLLKKRTVKL